MIRQSMQIINQSGLHLKPASRLCHAASQFQCNVTLCYQDVSVNAKSVLSILSACVKGGANIEIICEGMDEGEAMRAIANAVASGLGEVRSSE